MDGQMDGKRRGGLDVDVDGSKDVAEGRKLVF